MATRIPTKRALLTYTHSRRELRRARTSKLVSATSHTAPACLLATVLRCASTFVDAFELGSTCRRGAVALRCLCCQCTPCTPLCTAVEGSARIMSVMHSTLCVHVCTHQGDPCSGTAGTVRRGTLVPQQHAQFAAAVRSQLHHLLTLLRSLCTLSVPLAAAVAAR